MAKRDHKATLRRRNELARERGFKSYSDQRKQMTAWRNSDIVKRNRNISKSNVTVKNAQQTELAKLAWEAFKPGSDPDDYSVDGPKAKLFIALGYVESKEDWEGRYPNGVREYSLAAA